MKKNLLILIVILLVATLLRTVNLGSLPHGFQNDEVSFFYNAIVLLQTGADEDGRHLPIYLNSFIDQKPALFSYLQIPFIAILGKTVFAARLISALLGVASLLVLYKLVRQLSHNNNLALVVLFLAAISPWHIVLSRSTQEVMLSFFFFLLTLLLAAKLFLAKNTHSSKWWLFLLASMSSLLSIYAYHSAKLLLPLFTLALAIYSIFARGKGKIWPLAILLLQILFVLVTTFVSTGGLDRAAAVGLFSTGDTQLVLDEQIRIATATSSPLVIRIFHNKVINYVLAFLQTYFSHFTAKFLFFRGGDPTRYVVPFHGLLYLLESPLLIVGIFTTLNHKGKKRNLAWLFLSWLLLSPIPSALTTQESVSMIRSAVMVLPILYFTAAGCLYVWNFARSLQLKIAIRGVLLSGYIFGLAYFVHQYSVFQPRYRPWTRQYIDQELASYLGKHQADFSSVTIGKVTGQVYIYLALNNLISPASLQNSYPKRLQSDFILGKYHFVGDACFVGTDANALYVVGGTCVFSSQTPAYRKLAEIRYFDGAEGYLLVSPIAQQALVKKSSKQNPIAILHQPVGELGFGW